MALWLERLVFSYGGTQPGHIVAASRPSVGARSTVKHGRFTHMTHGRYLRRQLSWSNDVAKNMFNNSIMVVDRPMNITLAGTNSLYWVR